MINPWPQVCDLKCKHGNAEAELHSKHHVPSSRSLETESGFLSIKNTTKRQFVSKFSLQAAGNLLFIPHHLQHHGHGEAERVCAKRLANGVSLVGVLISFSSKYGEKFVVPNPAAIKTYFQVSGGLELLKSAILHVPPTIHSLPLPSLTFVFF